MIRLFLICALSLPVTNTRIGIVSYHPIATEVRSYHAVSDEQQKKDLEDWLRKHDEIDDVFIHRTPQTDKLKEHGYEKVPFTWKDHEIWIRRKPKTDQRLQEAA